MTNIQRGWVSKWRKDRTTDSISDKMTNRGIYLTTGALTMIPRAISFPVLLITVWMMIAAPAAVQATDKPLFSLEVTAEEPEVGDEFDVIISGQHLQDVYGFELRIRYHPDVLDVLDVSVSWEGFTVPAMIEDGEITIAHTKTGNVKGESGEVEFARIRFAVTADGETSVQLARIKLVDSEVNSITEQPDISLHLVIAPEIPVFSDIDNHWAKAEIIRAARMGWINGYPDGRFGPNDVVTRAQFTTMLSRALALEQTAGSGGNDAIADHYLDVDQIPDFAREHVSRATAAGIVRGFPDGTFGPQRLISRSESTVMIMRAIRYDEEMVADKTLHYRDADQIPDWAYAAVARATEVGLVKGVGDHRFAPHGITTRAEAVVLILRLLDYINQLQLAT